MRRKLVSLFFILVILFFGLPAKAAAEPADFTLPPKNVLVIFSYSPSYPSFDMLLDGLYEAFADQNVHLQVEYMDTKLVDPETASGLMFHQLQTKIKLLKDIDLIITFDDDALAFINQYYELLFGPDSTDTIPIVFSGCNNYVSTEAIYESRSNITGFLEPSARIKTLDVAVKLIPDYQSITILVDDSATAQGEMEQLITENVNNYPLTFINSNDYTYADLAEKLAKLTPRDIFLFISCYEDKDGTRMTYTQSANFLYTTLSTPIFCTTSYSVDTIFAGGYVHDKSQSGYDAGMVGRAILYDGTPAESFGLNRDPDSSMSYMFNTDMLARFDISASALPQEALRIHQSTSELITSSYPNMDQDMVYLSIFLGACIFILAGLAFFRHYRAVQREQIALTDSLTGAGSRMALDTKLDILINYCLDSLVSSTLVFLDVDGFKTINDRFGHPGGDAILKQVIERIQSVLSKKSDIYRYGGDEFIILMRMPPAESRPEINRIVAAFDAPFTVNNTTLPVHVSMGAVEIPVDGDTAEELVSKADIAMYAAKTFNATRAIFFSNLH